MNLSCGGRGRACVESAGRQKGRIRGAEDEEREPAVASRAVLGLEERRDGEKQREVGGDAVLILFQSEGGPVHAPCPMGWSLNSAWPTGVLR
jgi:hypothetical protein